MKNILVTGSNGFLGRKVVKSLLDQGATSISCLVREGSSLNGLPENEVKIVRGSLNNPADIKNALDGIDCVVHLAASMGGSPMGMYIETVVSTELLLDEMKNSSVQKLVFCSSFSVYGASALPKNSTLDENCPLEKMPQDRDAYGWCKYYQELWVKENIGSIDLVIIRPGVIYGEDKGLMSPRIGLHLPGLPFFLKIGSKARVPLTHVRNCADLIAMSTLNAEAKNVELNAVDDECPTQNEYLKMYEQRFGKIRNKIPMPYFLFLFASSVLFKLHKISKGNFPAIFTPYKTKSMYRPFKFSNQKAKTLLNWQPKVTLEEGLDEAKRFSGQ